VESFSGAQRASGGDVLLTTKLHVPAPRPELVPRPRLAEALDNGIARGLVLVCAPAGYGKTELLAECARNGRHRAAWLSLDEGDNDPARFWRHVVAALDLARPGIARPVRPLLGPPVPVTVEGLVTTLVNELSADAGDDQVLLVLDDYHVIDSRPVHDSVRFLIGHRPSGLGIVLAGRGDPPLRLSRLRAAGQLAELRAADLRFTPAEAAALLARVAGGPGTALPESAVAALAARTEGWAAGLQLAALSLAAEADPAQFVAAFTGSDRYVLDYLTEEVLERQDEPVRRFLLETSVLDRLSGELCDEVTGHSGSQALLEHIERAGLFLTPLDNVRGWWRYHSLFADLLRGRLAADPRRAALLHRNAAAWHEQHGLADAAFRHALAAGDATWAARLAEQHVDALLSRAEDATLQRWLSALPGEVVQSRPRLLLVQTWMAQWAGDTDRASRALAAAERAIPGAGDEPFEPSVGRSASLLANVPGAVALARAYLAHLRGDAEDTAGHARQALAALDEDEWMLASRARWHTALADWMRGDLCGAERGLEAAIAAWWDAGEHGLAVASCHLLGQVQRARGRLDVALGTYRQALEIAALPGVPALPVAGIGHIGIASVAYERDDFDAAAREVADGIALCRQIRYRPPLAAGLVTLARIRQVQGDPAGALRAIAEAEQIAPGDSVNGLLNPVPLERARLALAQGDVPAAARWAAGSGLSAEDEPRYAQEPGHLVLGRVLISQGRHLEALALLDQLHAAAIAQSRTGSAIEAGALRALALAGAGEEPAAVGALAGALAAGCPQGYTRVFADEGPSMAALLGRLIAASRSGNRTAREVPLGCLARLQRAFGREHPAAGPGRRAAQVPGLVDALTRREAEVLAMLATGRTNLDIASELVVTLDTVKKHVGHILAKLGAANRTEAVARAQQLGLIPD